MAVRSKGDGLEYLGKETEGKHAGKHKWRARLYWVELLTGIEREATRTFYLTTSAHPRAVARREELLEQLKKATPIGKAAKRERRRWRDASNAWYATLTAGGTLNTYGNYRKRIDAHFGEWFLDLVEPRHMKEWFAQLRPVNRRRRADLQKPEYEPGTFNGYREVARLIYEHALELGWVEAANPVDAVKRRSTRLQGLDELGEEPKRSLEEDEAVAHLVDMREREPEAYPLVLTAYHLGVRFGEVSALRLEDVDLETGKVKVRRGQYKGKKGRTKGRYARVAGLPLELREVLREHIARVQSLGYPGAHELLFPRPPWYPKRKRVHDFWSESTLHRKIDASYRRLGLRGEGVADPIRNTKHTARHTVATLAEGMASDSVIRKVLGQSVEVHRKYKHPGLAQVIELGEAVAARLKPKAKGGGQP